MKRSTLVFFIGFGVIGLHVLPHLQAVMPPPDGGYPGNNTAEGDDALLSLITGTNAESLRDVKGSTKSKFPTYSTSAVILPSTSFGYFRALCPEEDGEDFH